VFFSDLLSYLPGFRGIVVPVHSEREELFSISRADPFFSKVKVEGEENCARANNGFANGYPK
jgi:hypothetical protein